MTYDEPLFKDFLFPLVILLIGGIVTGLLIPLLTRVWHDYQAELKLKIELVEEIGKSVSRIVNAIQKAEQELNDKEKDEKTKSELKDKFKTSQEDWDINCSYIGSRINAYFDNESNQRIKKYWDSYYPLVINFYKLTEVSHNEGKKIIKANSNVKVNSKEINEKEKIINCLINYTQKIEKLDKKQNQSDNKVQEKSSKSKINWGILAHDAPNSDEYKCEWEKLKEKIFNMKHQLMWDILDSNISGFSRGLIHKRKIRRS